MRKKDGFGNYNMYVIDNQNCYHSIFNYRRSIEIDYLQLFEPKGG